MVLLLDIFGQCDESPRKYTSKPRQVETKPVCTWETFFIEILFNTTELTK